MKKIAVLLLLHVVLIAVTACSDWPGQKLVFSSRPGHEFPMQNFTEDSRLIIYEFSDFQCPACGSAYPTVQKLKLDYAGRIKVEYKHFPLINIHEKALGAAIAAECARQQGRFEEYHNILFNNQDSLSQGSLKNYAKDLGMDMARFNACLEGQEGFQRVQEDTYDAFAVGARATPTFFIAGQKIEGSVPYEQFKQAIDRQLTPS